MHKKSDELAAVYGARWPSLLAAAQTESPKVALCNKFAQADYTSAFRCQSTKNLSGYDETYADETEPFAAPDAALPAVYSIRIQQTGATPPCPQDSFLHALRFLTPQWTDVLSKNRLPPPVADSNGVFPYFLLDMASLAPVLALNVLPTHNVLDLCAAPGGKSLAIAQLLTPMGSLTINELSKERAKRLHHVMQGYLAGSPLVEQEKLFMTHRDATRWFAPGKYDRVLLDAPCSGERHVLQQSPAERRKSGKHFCEAQKTMANTQISMLIQAIETLAVGGRVVYSTCSLSPYENDFVVAKVLKRFAAQRGFRLRVVSAEVEFTPPFPMFAEKQKFGWVYLPDKVEGMPIGPIYFAAIEKLVGDDDGEEEEEEADEVSSG